MKFLAKAADGSYAYGTSVSDAHQQLRNNGSDVTNAQVFHVSDVHAAGKVNSTSDVLVVKSKKIDK
jgi:hypothetical protein